jgi:hypothetical protein
VAHRSCQSSQLYELGLEAEGKVVYESNYKQDLTRPSQFYILYT